MNKEKKPVLRLNYKWKREDDNLTNTLLRIEGEVLWYEPKTADFLLDKHLGKKLPQYVEITNDLKPGDNTSDKVAILEHIAGEYSTSKQLPKDQKYTVTAEIRKLIKGKDDSIIKSESAIQLKLSK